MIGCSGLSANMILEPYAQSRRSGGFMAAAALEPEPGDA